MNIDRFYFRELERSWHDVQVEDATVLITVAKPSFFTTLYTYITILSKRMYK